MRRLTSDRCTPAQTLSKAGPDGLSQCGLRGVARLRSAVWLLQGAAEGGSVLMVVSRAGRAVCVVWRGWVGNGFARCVECCGCGAWGVG